jgi:hypothetical protein
MSSIARKTIASIAALGAFALGGSAIAGAASSGSGQTATAASQSQQPPAGRHVGPDGTREQALSSADAAKVKEAVLAKYAGATIERVETDADHGSPFEAHITTKDGVQLEVLVNSDYAVTAANEMQAPPQP